MDKKYYSKYQKYKNRYIKCKKNRMNGGYRFNNIVPCIPNRSYNDIVRAKLTKFGHNIISLTEDLNQQNTLLEFSIMYDNIESVFKRSKLIAEGGYGQVWEYASIYHGKPCLVCVKIGRIDREGRISKWLQSNMDNLDVHSGRIYDCSYKYISKNDPTSILNGTHIFLMELMDGNLQSYVEQTKSIPIQFKMIGIFLILLGINRMFMRINKHGYVYTDSKIENILFRCDGGNFVIKLGDLGGLSRIGERGVYTYRSKFNPDRIAMMYDFAYGLYVMFNELIGQDKMFLELKPSNYVVMISCLFKDTIEYSDLSAFINLVNQQTPESINDQSILHKIDQVIIRILKHLTRYANFIIPYHYIGYNDDLIHQYSIDDDNQQWEGNSEVGVFMHKHGLDKYTSNLIELGYTDLIDILGDINFVHNLIPVPPDGNDSQFIDMYGDLVKMLPTVIPEPDYLLKTRLGIS